MGRNPGWFAQQRAKGICYICKQKMSDDDPNWAHRQCRNLLNQRKTYKEVQELVIGFLETTTRSSRT